MSRWVALWDAREPATVLAVVRVLVASVLLYDLLEVARLDLVTTLWAPASEGGIGHVGDAARHPWAFRLFGASASTARALHGVACAAALSFGLGLFTRFAGVVLVLSLAQLGAIYPEGDRGIDLLLRSAIVLLVLSESHATWSIDARLRHGTFHRPDVLVPAWPRYLMVLQLVWLYFSAGLCKTQLAWWPAGDWSALHYVLSDPHFARFAIDWRPYYRLTQAGTATTMLFELSAPVLLLAYRALAGPDTRGRRLLGAYRVAWIATGCSFHLLLLLTVRLGIFPLGVLALYPAFLRSEEVARLRQRLAPAGARVSG